MKLLNGQEIIQAFESFSPKSYALEGDKIGLQLGLLNKKVSTVLIALDVTAEVVEEAIKNKAELIIAHHPLIFRPLTTIQTDTAAGQLIEKLLIHNIAVYAAHTNLDVAEGGVNDLMADALQLTDTSVLVKTQEDPLLKLAVFVPESHAQAVRESIGNAGAGSIGDYVHCSYNISGQGMFKPTEGSDPYIGEKGKMTITDEVKIESIFPKSLEKRIIQAMKSAHPYEEIAYDLYNLKIPGKSFGLGRIGYLKNEMSLNEFAEKVKTAFEVPALRMVGAGDKKVKKVAVLGGDGNKYTSHAIRQGADVYVTGDIYYHVAHDAMMDGLSMIDPGHNVEKIMKQGVKKKLEAILEMKRSETKIIASAIHTDPFKFK